MSRVAERTPTRSDYPGALPHMLKAGSLVFNPPEHPVDLRDWSQWWAFTFGANWRRPYGPQVVDQGPRRSSGGARRLRGCRGLRGMGRQGAADGGRVGVCRPRRPRRRRVRLGRRAHAGRAAHGQHLAGDLPVPEQARGRLRAHLAGHGLPAERLRPLRHDRQRLGMDDGLVRRPSTRPTRRRRAAFRRIRAAAARRRATTPASRRSGFRARC